MLVILQSGALLFPEGACVARSLALRFGPIPSIRCTVGHEVAWRPRGLNEECEKTYMQYVYCEKPCSSGDGLVLIMSTVCCWPTLMLPMSGVSLFLLLSLSNIPSWRFHLFVFFAVLKTHQLFPSKLPYAPHHALIIPNLADKIRHIRDLKSRTAIVWVHYKTDQVREPHGPKDETVEPDPEEPWWFWACPAADQQGLRIWQFIPVNYLWTYARTNSWIPTTSLVRSGVVLFWATRNWRLNVLFVHIPVLVFYVPISWNHWLPDLHLFIP